MVLGAREKNAALEGTIANEISRLRSDITAADLVVSNVKLISNTHFTNLDPGSSWIESKNGWVLINLNYIHAVNASLPYEHFETVLVELPRPAFSIWHGFAPVDSQGDSLQAGVLPDGTMKMYGGTTGCYYRISFSYPSTA